LKTENTYSIGQVLSMTTGRLVCHLEDLYAIASGLLGRSVYTHELPAAFRECKPWILAHHPQLEAITGDEVTSENWCQWIDAHAVALGDSFVVPPLTYSATAEKSPLETLHEMVGDKPVIVLNHGGAAPE
jgi:hypothetical protein